MSFDGIHNIYGVAPPDTQGDIGPNHYMQWVNSHLAAWSIDRTTWTSTLVLGPVAGNAIWAALGGPCASENWGDPIVLWDRFRSRWVISQFALGPTATGPYKTAIAVSKTADPTGAWWLYCFDYHPTTLNDYPKFGRVAGRLLLHLQPVHGQRLRLGRRGPHGVRSGQDDQRRPHGPPAQGKPGRREPELWRHIALALRGHEQPAGGVGLLRGSGRQHLDNPGPCRRTPSHCGKPTWTGPPAPSRWAWAESRPDDPRDGLHAAVHRQPGLHPAAADGETWTP